MEIVDGFRADSGAKMVMVEAEAWGKLLLVINVNDHQIKTDDSHVLAPVPLFDLLPPASSPLPFAPPHVLLVQMPDFDALEARFLAAFGTSLEAHRAGSTTGQPHDLPPLDRDSFKNIWIPEMENDFTTLLIPEVDWIYVGMFYLPEGIIKTAVKRTREVRTQSGGDWTWADYQSAVMGAIGGFMSSFGVSLEENRVGSTMGKPQGLPSLDREAFTNIWIPEMENDFTKLEIPYADWVYGGMLYLPEGIVKTVVKQTRDEIRKGTGAEWTWDDYKFAVLAAIDSINLIKRVGTGVALGVTLGPAIIVGGLGILGFGAAGVGAGSIAAIVQSIVYRGATGGMFSALQSIAATGVVGAAGTATAGVVGGTVAAVSNLFYRRRR